MAVGNRERRHRLGGGGVHLADAMQNNQEQDEKRDIESTLGRAVQPDAGARLFKNLMRTDPVFS